MGVKKTEFAFGPVRQRQQPVPIMRNKLEQHLQVSIVPGITTNTDILLRQARDTDLHQGLKIFKGHA